MATATLMEPKARPAKRPTSKFGCPDSYRLPRVGRKRVQEALERRIEYIAGDWSRVSEREHDCHSAPEPRRLASDEEATLFRRMNYLKHRADRLRRVISKDYCPPDTLDAIERLLEALTYEGVIFSADLMMFEKALITLKGVLTDVDPGFNRADYVLRSAVITFVKDMIRMRLLKVVLEEVWALYRYSLFLLLDIQRVLVRFLWDVARLWQQRPFGGGSG